MEFLAIASNGCRRACPTTKARRASGDQGSSHAGTLEFNAILRNGLLTLALLGQATLVSAAKTDIILLDNGAKVIGDIKQLRRGLLEVSTDNMSRVYIDWTSVTAVTTTKNYTVETASGLRAFGSIATSTDHRVLIIAQEGVTIDINKTSVVGIHRVKETFLKRWDGSISVGGSAKKANSEVGLVAAFDARYRTHLHLFNVSLYSSVSDREDSPFNERHNLNLLHSAFIVTNWFSLALADFERNTELRLDLRSLLSGGASYRLLENYRNQLTVSTGLSLNHEQYVISDLDRVSAEAFADLTYDVYKQRTPKMDSHISVTVFPSLTEDNRYRTTVSASTTWEMVKNFWFELSLYYMADSNPPSDDARSADGEQEPRGTDWGLDTSLRWKF